MSPRWPLAGALALLAGCNTVGFHEESKVDFARYPRAAVAPMTTSTSYSGASPVPEGPWHRFTDEVRRLGGFESVEEGPTDADLVIHVDVTHVAIDEAGQACCHVAGFLVTTLLDEGCEEAQVSVGVRLDMEAVDADSGEVVYAYTDAEGTSTSYECTSDRELNEAYAEALDDALDEVALYFLAGFDI